MFQYNVLLLVIIKPGFLYSTVKLCRKFIPGNIRENVHRNDFLDGVPFSTACLALYTPHRPNKLCPPTLTTVFSHCSKICLELNGVNHHCNVFA